VIRKVFISHSIAFLRRLQVNEVHLNFLEQFRRKLNFLTISKNCHYCHKLPLKKAIKRDVNSNKVKLEFKTVIYSVQNTERNYNLSLLFTIEHFLTRNCLLYSNSPSLSRPVCTYALMNNTD
jgi:hypothetical protein